MPRKREIHQRDAAHTAVSPDDAAFRLPPLEDERAPIAADAPDFELPPLEDDHEPLLPSDAEATQAGEEAIEPAEAQAATAPRTLRPRRKRAEAAQPRQPQATAARKPGRPRTAPARPGKPAARPSPTAVQAPSNTVLTTQGDLAQLLRLWAELSPQGRRATLWYVSALVVDEQ